MSKQNNQPNYSTSERTDMPKQNNHLSYQSPMSNLSTNIKQQLTFSVAEATDQLGYKDKRTVRRLIHTGALKGFKPKGSNRYLIPRQALIEFSEGKR